jgi:hypothetical protein
MIRHAGNLVASVETTGRETGDERQELEVELLPPPVSRMPASPIYSVLLA